MAKAAYKPAQMLQEDPLAALKKVTEGRSRIDARREETDKSETNLVEAPSLEGVDARAKQFDEVSKPVKPVEANWSARSVSVAPTKPLARQVKPARSTFYLYPEDITKLRLLSGYASTQHGLRANDSIIMRAALSLVESDVRFMHALEEAMLADRRKAKP